MISMFIGGIVVLGLLVGMFIVVYAMNQNTNRPAEHENLTTDTKGCFNINKGSKRKE